MDRNQYRYGRRKKDQNPQQNQKPTWKTPPHVPGIHATYAQVHKGMRPLLWGTYVIIGLMGVIFILICLNAGLPPGMLDPDTGTVRWVSDGFKDYPLIPWMIFLCLCTMCVIFWFFAVQACKFTPPLSNEPVTDISQILGLAATISCMGFLLLTIKNEGAFHYTGAGFFICFYIMMQACFYRAIDRVHKATLWEKILEFGLPIISILCALFFLVFLIAGMAYKSYSALFEYGVFVTFLGINAYGVSMMVYICKWYYPLIIVIEQRVIIRWYRFPMNNITKQPWTFNFPVKVTLLTDGRGNPIPNMELPPVQGEAVQEGIRVVEVGNVPAEDGVVDGTVVMDPNDIPDSSPPYQPPPRPAHPQAFQPHRFRHPPQQGIPPPPGPPIGYIPPPIHGNGAKIMQQLVIPF